MSDPVLGLTMLGLIVLAIMMGFPTAFTMMGPCTAQCPPPEGTNSVITFEAMYEGARSSEGSP